MLSIILSVKKSLNDEDGFFTDLAARRGPDLFLYIFSAPIYGFVRLYLFSIPFLSFSWSQHIQNYSQLMVVRYHNYYHLEHQQEFFTSVSVELLQNFRIHLMFFLSPYFHIDVFFLNLFNFLCYLGHISFIFCLIVVTSTLQFIVFIYIIFIYESISKKRFFTFI